MRIYLCKKYKLSGAILSKAESDWCEMSLDLAVHERNPELALKVRSVRPHLTRKQRLKCLVASNKFAYFLYYLYYIFLVKTRLYGKTDYCTFDCPLNLSLGQDGHSQ